MEYSQPRPDPMLPEYGTGVDAMPLPLAVYPRLPHLPPQPWPGIHMHVQTKQSQNRELILHTENMFY